MYLQREQLRIIAVVRRVVFIFACLFCALNVHASVPSQSSAKANSLSANAAINEDLTALQLKQRFNLATAPADKLSFYEEFYGDHPATPRIIRKTGLLHWFTITLKKTVQKVNFLP